MQSKLALMHNPPVSSPLLPTESVFHNKMHLEMDKLHAYYFLISTHEKLSGLSLKLGLQL